MLQKCKVSSDQVVAFSESYNILDSMVIVFLSHEEAHGTNLLSRCMIVFAKTTMSKEI